MTSKPYNREDNIEPLDPEYAQDYNSPTNQEIDYDLRDVIDARTERAYRLGYWRCVQNDHRIRT